MISKKLKFIKNYKKNLDYSINLKVRSMLEIFLEILKQFLRVI